MAQPMSIKLSICIGTYNRAAFIGAALDSILSQVTDECEIVISDNASTDGTEEVVAQYAQRFKGVHYFKQDENRGFDQNFDRAVELARGEYCWLMADDDVLKPGAIATVLDALRRDLSLIVVNVEARSFDLSRVLQCRWLAFESDRVYPPEQMELLFVEANPVLKFVGCVIIKRAIWSARERQRYYGTWFVFLAVIFQERLPGDTLVIAEPLIVYRKGNQITYSSMHSEIWFSKLPSVLRSFTTVSESSKDKFWSTEPWKNLPDLLRVRALGLYSLREYKQWIRPRLRSTRERWTSSLIALLPGVLVNALFVLYYSVTRRNRDVWQPEMELERLRESRFHLRNWRPFKRGA